MRNGNNVAHKGRWPTRAMLKRAGHKSKASQIRRLAQLGATVKEVAELVGVRYQHAYNVLHTQLAQDYEGIPAKSR